MREMKCKILKADGLVKANANSNTTQTLTVADSPFSGGLTSDAHISMSESSATPLAANVVALSNSNSDVSLN
jgi:hypothetical protein